MTDLPADIDSEATAADWLYGLTPDAFVGTRNQLVKQLRADGKRELAAAVALLRRPTVIAGELNRVLRLDRALLEAVLDSAMALRDGHQQVLDGDAVEFGELQRTHRQATIHLAEMADRNHVEIQSIIESASLDESFHAQLRAASFAAEPAPQSGFDLLTPTATVTSLSEARAKREARSQAAAAREVATREGGAAKVTASQAELETASKAVGLAERRLDAATKAEAKAQERVTAIAAQLAEATNYLADSEAKRAAADLALDRARERLEEATVDAADGDSR